MQILADYHTHTTYSHGKGTIEENVLEAISKGIKAIGISDHGYKHLTYGIKLDDIYKMREEVNKLNEKYSNIEILLGMTKSSLSQKKHEDICRMVGFLNSSKGMPKISCRYICNGPEVHSKVYVWTTPDDTVGELPQVAFCGSLNYTMNAFYKRRESVSMCSSIMAYRYYQELLADTIDCFDPAVSEKLKNIKESMLPLRFPTPHHRSDCK